MIGRLVNDARDVVHALLASRHVVHRLGEIERDIVTLEERLEDLDSIVTELYVGSPTEKVARDA